MRCEKTFITFGIVLLLTISFVSAGITGSAVNGEDDFSDDKEEFQTDWDEDCGDFDCDELEIRDAGITPDSVFYFLDNLFDSFGDDLEIREEKVAEIKAMVEAGDYEATKEALDKYKEHAEKLEDIDPEREEEAKKSSIIIEKTLREIESDIPEEYKDDLVNGIIIKEGKIRTAVEISVKIKELCIQLAELDPIQYKETCRSGKDGPKWKKDLDKDLTEDQKIEAKKFGNIMSQCFKTSGRDCNCEDISFYDFSVVCNKVAPLAAECDTGNEDACRKMDEIEMPDLPDYLQDILDDIESQYGEDKYDMHMPPECIEAGATTPKECGEIMIKENAPIECRQALLDSGCDKERDCREICDKIMGNSRGPEEFGPPGQCMNIEDSMKRLECFEEASRNVEEHYGIGEKFEEGRGEITWQCKENRIHWPPDCERFMREGLPEQERRMEDEQRREWEQKDDWRVKEKECAQKCESEGRSWDYYSGECTCKERDFDNGGNNCDTMYCQQGTHCEKGRGCVSDEGNGPDYPNEGYQESECKDGCSQECGNQDTDCVNDKCVCLGGGDDSPQYAEGERPGEPEDSDNDEESEPEQEPAEVTE